MSKLAPLALAMAAVLALAAPASAKHAKKPVHDPYVHPAFWTVHGPKATAYLFGSVHILPPNINWKSPALLAAMKKSDTFIFEIPLDHQDKDRDEAQRIQKEIMDVHGMLPPGISLRGELSNDTVPKYDAVLAQFGISPGYIDRLQPWLASMVLETAQFFRSDANAMNGVDVQIYAIASDAHKDTHGFETLEQQLNIIGSEEQKSGLKELSHTIDEAMSSGQASKFDVIVSEWEHGDVQAIAHETDVEFAKDPELRKTMLDDRTARWAVEMRTLLDQPHTYFITVGAAHLAGPNGLPALLRKDGYQVDGP